MRSILAILIGLTLACSGKKKEEGGTASGSAGSGTAVTSGSGPASCPPGNVVKDGACVAVITPEKVAVVTQQQTRLDELAKLLDKVETLGAPIELLNGVIQLEEWKKFAASSAELQALDKVIAVLADAVKQLREFKGGLGESAQRLGNLKVELDRMMTDTGTAKRLEEVRAQVSSQIRTAIDPLATQVLDAIQKGIAPLIKDLEETSDLILGACVLAKRTGGDKVKTMCGSAKELFAKGLAFLEEVKTKPAMLFDDITKQLTAQLDTLIDDQTKALLGAAQVKVNEALKLPAGGAGSGSAAVGSGSGSAGSATK
ncbi:MAG TPA: hypothetical protein VIU61_20680 [Kofleriaceae bacterium]